MGNNAFVVCMGIGTVFAGLILIIVMCKTVSLICGLFGKQNPPQGKPETPPASNELSAQKRREIIAAVTAACAEEMGADVSALRVVSFKKL